MWGSVVKSILGGGEVIKEGFKLIDDLHTSDVEEIEARTAAKTKILDAYAPFKVAQRLLALRFTALYIACFLLVLGATIVPAIEVDIEAVRGVISEFYMGEITLSIVLFYFGGGFAEGLTTRIKGGK